MDSSEPPSGSDSNANASVGHSGQRNFLMYKMQIIEGMKKMNQDLLQIDKNLRGFADKSGPFKSQLSDLINALPDPNSDFLFMETD
ncbi:hypothetical protein K1T71_004148 [Dendrolimus kikuchii]|uniref:Uncharacterized protein n=1 Tax=Dendrolimus kikuchii TaxID=765133 RepID=A0ACC1DAE8_9NEOP|nr:hypothetical protein K1T71_004148 [Dendrolimus kikuchii]